MTEWTAKEDQQRWTRERKKKGRLDVGVCGESRHAKRDSEVPLQPGQADFVVAFPLLVNPTRTNAVSSDHFGEGNGNKQWVCTACLEVWRTGRVGRVRPSAQRGPKVRGG